MRVIGDNSAGFDNEREISSALNNHLYDSINANLRHFLDDMFKGRKRNIDQDLWYKVQTWMHKPSKGDISFFKLSRIMPQIFSTYAVSCCLKRRAGYFASTCLKVSTPPFRPPFIKERLTPCGVPRKLYKQHKPCECVSTK